MAELSYSTETREEWLILTFTGNFTFHSIPQVRKQLDEVEAGAALRIAVDIMQVTGIDAATMTMLLNFARNIRRKGGETAVIGPGEAIKDVFSRIGFDADIPLFGSRLLFEQSAPRS